jgi:OOP family OmpA-OmpF porin
VSRILPDAIALRANDEQLTRALAPSVEEAITASVRRDPRPLADALFPVIGPAIRKAIAHTLSTMLESVSRTVEHSLSWRALQWRWTAIRSGKPFAEIVLLNTLRYRVEQVLLIHAETGLLLQHIAADGRADTDADQVSAMLTAIRDFARDSIKGVGSADGLDAVRIGDFWLWIEQGPQAILACVVRGSAPPSVREMFQVALESVHRQFTPELKAFRGDAAPFERARPLLESCLVSELRERPRAPSPRRWLAAAAVVLAALGLWTFFTVRERQRWNAYVDRLRAEPGIVVVSSGTRGGKFHIAGLRDPMAADPAALAASAAFGPDVIESRWEPYQALNGPFVAARASALLRPPAGVTLAFRDGVLTARGPASEQWLEESERLALAVGGVRAFEYDGPARDARLKSALEQISLLFIKGQARLVPGQARTIQRIHDLLQGLNDWARAGGKRVRIVISGHTDSDGPETLNLPLSQARADTMLSVVGTELFGALDFSTIGAGVTPTATSGETEAQKERNRRVSFRVQLPADGPGAGSRP